MMRNNIYDLAIEMYLKQNYSLLKYKNFNDVLKVQNTEEDKEIEDSINNEEDKSDFEEFKSAGCLFEHVIGWNGGMYTPPAFRESFQLSIWKIEPYGTVKIVNKYFTPKTQRATDFDFPGFTLQLSMDEQTMLMVEKDHEKHKELLVVSFDMYNLEILNEMLVSVVDESIRNEPYYQGIGSEDNTNYKGPYQINSNMSKIASWNFGTYLICGVSTSCKSRIIYKFVVYNLRTSSYICTIERHTEKALEEKIFSISCDENREYILHIATMEKDCVSMLEFDIFSRSIKLISKYTGFNIFYALPTEDMKNLYLIHQDAKTKQFSLYCTIYKCSFGDVETWK